MRRLVTGRYNYITKNNGYHLAIFLAVILLLSSVIFLSRQVSVSAYQGPKIYFSPAKGTYNPGDTIKPGIIYSNNQAQATAYSLTAAVSFDHSRLSFKGYNCPKRFQTCYVSLFDNGGLYVYIASNRRISSDQVKFVTLKFKAVKNGRASVRLGNPRVNGKYQDIEVGSGIYTVQDPPPPTCPKGYTGKPPNCHKPAAPPSPSHTSPPPTHKSSQSHQSDGLPPPPPKNIDRSSAGANSTGGGATEQSSTKKEESDKSSGTKKHDENAPPISDLLPTATPEQQQPDPIVGTAKHSSGSSGRPVLFALVALAISGLIFTLWRRRHQGLEYALENTGATTTHMPISPVPPTQPAAPSNNRPPVSSSAPGAMSATTNEPAEPHHPVAKAPKSDNKSQFDALIDRAFYPNADHGPAPLGGPQSNQAQGSDKKGNTHNQQS